MIVVMKTVAISAFLLLGASLAPAQAEPVTFGPSLSGQGWKTLNFRGLKPVDFKAEGANRLAIRAEGAASVIWRELDENLWAKRQAKWRWKVDQSVPATNLAVKGADDRAIALYFVFAKDEASAKSAKGAASLSSAMWWSSGAALVYIWGGDGTRGQVVASPHMGASGKLVLRQPGGITNASFLPEAADLAADFRRAFGREPGPLVGIAISSDSDDTKGTNLAAIEALSVE
jgi:hypothetical protein